jgi:hypothetical protein
MVDVQTIMTVLRRNGHVVEKATPLPENAGDYEFVVDGNTLTLAEVRAMIVIDEAQ